MTQIASVTPDRFRVGDTVVIAGFAFSPVFGSNAVRIGSFAATILSESETEISVEVPAGIETDAYVAVQVQRTDTFDNDVVPAWSSGSGSAIAQGTIPIPGQAPGPLEDADPSPQPDTPQAQDYERLATLVEYLLREAWSAKGDVLSHDGSAVAVEAVGADGEQLEALPAGINGLAWDASPNTLSLAWGKQIDAANTLNGPMVANGSESDTSLVDGEQPSGKTGTLDSVSVYVQAGAGGDTLDQVAVYLDGGLAYTSTPGQAIPAGGFYFVTGLGLGVTPANRIEIRANKTGTNGIMILRGKATVEW